MSNAVRVYEIYPTPHGYSPRAADFCGTTIAVAAKSIRQAYALARKGAWAKDPDRPLGILWRYREEEHPAYRLFHGDTRHGVAIRREARTRAIAAWMRGVLAGQASAAAMAADISLTY